MNTHRQSNTADTVQNDYPPKKRKTEKKKKKEKTEVNEQEENGERRKKVEEEREGIKKETGRLCFEGFNLPFLLSNQLFLRLQLLAKLQVLEGGVSFIAGFYLGLVVYG